MRPRLALITSLLLAPAITASIAAPRSAEAQPAQDPIKDVARQRYQDGVKAFDAGRFEEARAAFAQAYALTQVPAVLLNLGLAEAKTNRCVEGGNHLVKFLREHKEATDVQKTTAGAAIEDCKKKVALLTITVDATGAELTVDGASVGKSPLPDALFVEPGPRTVVATLSGKSATTSVDARRGQVATASVVLRPSTTPAPEPGPGRQPEPELIPQPTPTPEATGPDTDPTVPGPQPLPPESSGREDFGSWVTSGSGVVFWIGTGVFAAGVGVGAGFAVASSRSSADAELIADNIRDQASDDGVDGSPCGPEDGGGGGDVYPEQCDQLRDALGVHTANVAVMGVGWGLAGVGAVGTVIYTMVDWYSGSKPKDERAARPSFAVLPMLSPEVRGLTVTGSF